MMAGSLETVKLVSDVVSNVGTLLALLVGGVWAYWAFIRERTHWPRAELTLLISHRNLTVDQALLQVKVMAHNVGSLRITASQLRVDVYRVLPLDEEMKGALEAETLVPKGRHEADWPLLPGGEVVREWGAQIEPGESDELCFDLVVPRELETVHVYAYLRNVKHRRRELGWQATTFYDLSGGSSEKRIVFGSDEEKVALRSRSASPKKSERGQQEPRRPGGRRGGGSQGQERSNDE